MATKGYTPFKKHDPWLHLVHQKILVEKHFPCFSCRIDVRNRMLKCVGDIQPCPVCSTYTVSIVLVKGGVPKVKIVSPHIQPAAAIHMYSNGSLCLYDHREQPWNADDNLHEKIIPWTAEWLVYYELYKLDGVWLGPEAPHGAAPKKPQEVLKNQRSCSRRDM